MNNYIRTAGVLAVALFAGNAQAYTYHVKNFTNADLEVFVRFQGFLGLGEGEESLGIAKGGGGTTKRSFGGGRIGQCVMPNIRIGEKSVTAVFPVSISQLDDMFRMKNDPKMLSDYMGDNQIKPAGTMLCFDRIFYIFQGMAGTFLVVTPNGL